MKPLKLPQKNQLMHKPEPRYKFYATLLDAFQWYLTSEADDAFQEFINKINRLPFTSEAAEKGTAFNELVDIVAAGNLQDLFSEGKIYVKTLRNNEVYIYTHTDRRGVIWTFDFKINLVTNFANRYKNAIPQIRTVGYLETSRGWVELYGNLDEIECDIVTDIKTTGKYEFPKFLHNFQHLVYPFTLNQEGIPITQFTYDITDFTNEFKEDYVYNPEKAIPKLKTHCEHLIDFLEMNRHLITDKKVFALDGVRELIPVIPTNY